MGAVVSIAEQPPPLIHIYLCDSEMKDLFLLLYYVWPRSQTSFLSLWLSLRSYSDRENHRHLLGLNNVLDSNNTQRSGRVLDIFNAEMLHVQWWWSGFVGEAKRF